MSTAKRPRRRQIEARSASPLPASKRLKTANSPHVPFSKSRLSFLVDENTRAGRSLEARLTNGVPHTKTTRVDESHAVVAPNADDDDDEPPEGVDETSHEVINISSGEEESSEIDDDDDDDDDDDEEENDADEEENDADDDALRDLPAVNGHQLRRDAEEDARLGAAQEDDEMRDVESGNADQTEDADADAEEPSFGDMLQSRHPDPIDVSANYAAIGTEKSTLMGPSGHQNIVGSSGTSLSAVLQQALKTNDKQLLESCFQTTDLPSVRATVERLPPQHVTTLLQRLAERIHKRPGRTGNLMVWVQWSLVAHGGYLVTQPDLMRQLKSLSQVVRERAKGLQPLLHLKGKLDLLHAQLELRRNTYAAARAAHGEEEDDEEAVVYVEGQGDDWSDGDEVEGDEMGDRMTLDRTLQSNEPPAKGQFSLEQGADEDVESGEDIPNGLASEADEGSDMDDEDDEAGEDMFDDEAEETSNDEDDEMDSDEEAEDSEVESDDEAEDLDDESDQEEIKQPNPHTLNRKR